jgi:two-component system, chemotaxis family, protein-glutamate methylesterase/glutaminase
MAKKSYDAVVIGGSSGSMAILNQIIPSLRQDLRAAVIVVYHIHPDSGDFMVKQLDKRSEIRVRQAEDKEVIVPGVVYVAPPNYHLLVELDRSIALSIDAPVNYCRPSIDILFESASDAYTDKLVGIILSGANTDGTLGLKYVKNSGGITVVQSPQSAEMDAMPQSALSATAVDYVLEPQEIGPFLNRLTA